MILKRPSAERGHASHGWLETRHTFSFADYHDPRHMHFRALRVINEDTIRAGTGFGTHPHRDMEIVTYVIRGELTHRDSMGNRGVLRPGFVQAMSAGTGVAHSEVNESTDDVHLLQIWLLPDARGHAPRWEDRWFPPEARHNTLCPIASGAGAGGALPIHQDATIFATVLDAGREVTADLAPGRHAWIQVARGGVTAFDEELAAGDGMAVSGHAAVRVAARTDAELLVFDLA